MTSATDSAEAGRRRRPWTILVLVTLAIGPGCARLRPFRHEDRPAFGTDAAWSERQPQGRSPGGDLHTSAGGSARRTEAGARAAPDANARALRTKPADPTGTEHVDASGAAAPRPSIEPAPRVALQPPVATPVRGETSTRPVLSPTAVTAATAYDGRRQGLGESAAPATTVGAGHHAPDRELASILSESRKALEALPSYQVRMTHQERVGGDLKPVEEILLSIRRTPKAVRLEWPDGPNKGREVIYASNGNRGLMHVRMSEALGPLSRLSMAPDSPMATRNSRHPITEAGFDTIVHRMEEAEDRQHRGDHSLGQIRYEGREAPAGSSEAGLKIVRVTPDNETWTVFLDPDSHLPEFVEAVSGKGELLERYRFRELKSGPAELSRAEAFDPDARWGPSKGLLQRLARAASAADAKPPAR